jgi:hypothetical protein
LHQDFYAHPPVATAVNRPQFLCSDSSLNYLNFNQQFSLSVDDLPKKSKSFIFHHSRVNGNPVFSSGHVILDTRWSLPQHGSGRGGYDGFLRDYQVCLRLKSGRAERKGYRTVKIFEDW